MASDIVRLTLNPPIVILRETHGNTEASNSSGIRDLRREERGERWVPGHDEHVRASGSAAEERQIQLNVKSFRQQASARQLDVSLAADVNSGSQQAFAENAIPSRVRT